MYRTTRKFLEYFGLKDLSDLPTLEDFKESALKNQVSPDQTVLLFDESSSGGTAETVDYVSKSEVQPAESTDPNISNDS